MANPFECDAAQIAVANTIYQGLLGQRTQYGTFYDHHAAAMVEQAFAESSFDLDARGDNDAAFSLFQDHTARCAAIKAATGIDIEKSPTVEQVVEAVLWELENPEHAALEKILATTNAYDAGYAACEYYERAGAPGQPAKRAAATVLWAAYFAALPA